MTSKAITYSVHNARHLKLSALNHKQKVCRLYKAALTNLRWNNTDNFLEYREKAVKLRARFEANRHIKDFRIAKQLLKEGQEEVHRTRPDQPTNFTFSPNGTAYQRQPGSLDIHIDMWDPLEKAMYPYYFARREQRKQEYIKLFESDFGDALKLIGVEQQVDYAALVEEINAKLALADGKAKEEK